MRCIISVIIFLNNPFFSIGQFNKYESPDTIFKFYNAPIISNKVYSRLEKDEAILYVACYCTTDTSGQVVSQKFIPFFDIGNKYESTDSIWHLVIAALTIASKSWVFKPILWDFKGDKKLQAEVNKNPFQRPFTGRPRYLLIYEVAGIQSTFIDKISFIKDFRIGS